MAENPLEEIEFKLKLDISILLKLKNIDKNFREWQNVFLREKRRLMGSPFERVVVEMGDSAGAIDHYLHRIYLDIMKEEHIDKWIKANLDHVHQVKDKIGGEEKLTVDAEKHLKEVIKHVNKILAGIGEIREISEETRIPTMLTDYEVSERTIDYVKSTALKIFKFLNKEEEVLEHLKS